MDLTLQCDSDMVIVEETREVQTSNQDHEKPVDSASLSGQDPPINNFGPVERPNPFALYKPSFAEGGSPTLIKIASSAPLYPSFETLNWMKKKLPHNKMVDYYNQLLGLFDEMKSDLNPILAGNKAALDRVKKAIYHGRLLLNQLALDLRTAEQKLRSQSPPPDQSADVGFPTPEPELELEQGSEPEVRVIPSLSVVGARSQREFEMKRFVGSVGLEAGQEDGPDLELEHFLMPQKAPESEDDINEEAVNNRNSVRAQLEEMVAQLENATGVRPDGCMDLAHELSVTKQQQISESQMISMDLEQQFYVQRQLQIEQHQQIQKELHRKHLQQAQNAKEPASGSCNGQFSSANDQFYSQEAAEASGQYGSSEDMALVAQQFIQNLNAIQTAANQMAHTPSSEHSMNSPNFDYNNLQMDHPIQPERCSSRLGSQSTYSNGSVHDQGSRNDSTNNIHQQPQEVPSYMDMQPDDPALMQYNQHNNHGHQNAHQYQSPQRQYQQQQHHQHQVQQQQPRCNQASVIRNPRPRTQNPRQSNRSNFNRQPRYRQPLIRPSRGQAPLEHPTPHSQPIRQIQIPPAHSNRSQNQSPFNFHSRDFNNYQQFIPPQPSIHNPSNNQRNQYQSHHEYLQ